MENSFLQAWSATLRYKRSYFCMAYSNNTVYQINLTDNVHIYIMTDKFLLKIDC